MNIVKALIAAAALCMSFSAFALTDDEQVEYTDAVNNGKVKIVKKYLDQGVNVNERYFAWTPLQMAAVKGQLEVAKMLVEKGAELDYKHPVTKMTALHMAAEEGHEEVVKYLLSKGANPNVKLKANVSLMRLIKDQGNTKMLAILEAAGAKDDGCQEARCF
jgi:ankyrin repeat protein